MQWLRTNQPVKRTTRAKVQICCKKFQRVRYVHCVRAPLQPGPATERIVILTPRFLPSRLVISFCRDALGENH